jgi:hypothetical protein
VAHVRPQSQARVTTEGSWWSTHRPHRPYLLLFGRPLKRQLAPPLHGRLRTLGRRVLAKGGRRGGQHCTRRRVRKGTRKGERDGWWKGWGRGVGGWGSTRTGHTPSSPLCIASRTLPHNRGASLAVMGLERETKRRRREGGWGGEECRSMGVGG